VAAPAAANAEEDDEAPRSIPNPSRIPLADRHPTTKAARRLIAPACRRVEFSLPEYGQ